MYADLYDQKEDYRKIININNHIGEGPVELQDGSRSQAPKTSVSGPNYTLV